MEVAGNPWLEAWNNAKPVPARRQKRLFDDTREAEKVGELVNIVGPVRNVEIFKISTINERTNIVNYSRIGSRVPDGADPGGGCPIVVAQRAPRRAREDPVGAKDRRTGAEKCPIGLVTAVILVLFATRQVKRDAKVEFSFTKPILTFSNP